MNKKKKITFHYQKGIFLKTSVEKLTAKEIQEQKKEDRKELEFKKSIKNHKVYQLLDKMIDELGNANVDVSYFPFKARKVLVKYSNKLEIKK